MLRGFRACTKAHSFFSVSHSRIFSTLLSLVRGKKGSSVGSGSPRLLWVYLTTNQGAQAQEAWTGCDLEIGCLEADCNVYDRNCSKSLIFLGNSDKRRGAFSLHSAPRNNNVYSKK